jgi:hypothetical protein
MRRRRGGILVLAMLAPTAALAASGQAQFLVRVNVPERVTVEAVEQPARLLLSEADIERGYKDVSARYVVSSNTGRGWLLRLDPRLGLTRHIEVRGLGQRLVLHDQGIEIHRLQPGRRESLALEYRFVLAPDAGPGVYDLPVFLTAAPL